MLIWTIEGIKEKDYLQAVLCGLAFVLDTLYVLVQFGVFKPFVVRPKLVDLATYTFGTDAIPHDLKISLERADILDTLLSNAIQNQITDSISPSLIARGIIEELDLKAEDAMYIIYKSALAVGVGKRLSGAKKPHLSKLEKAQPSKSDADFARTLEELRDKLKKAKEERKDNPPDDEPQKGGKYGFL
jgi:hypothetical protein